MAMTTAHVFWLAYHNGKGYAYGGLFWGFWLTVSPRMPMVKCRGSAGDGRIGLSEKGIKRVEGKSRGRYLAQWRSEYYYVRKEREGKGMGFGLVWFGLV